MIPDHVVIDAIARADAFVDAGLQSFIDDGAGTELLYRDAYLTLVSRLHDAIGREAPR